MYDSVTGGRELLRKYSRPGDHYEKLNDVPQPPTIENPGRYVPSPRKSIGRNVDAEAQRKALGRL